MTENQVEEKQCSCMWCLYEWHCDWTHFDGVHCPKFEPDLSCAFGKRKEEDN